MLPVSELPPEMAVPANPRVVLVQPFSLRWTGGGGARILRSMLQDQPLACRSLNTTVHRGPAADWIDERHVPPRITLVPSLLERSRLALIGQCVEVVSRPGFGRRLRQEIDAWKPDVIHALVHGPSDFHVAWRAARRRGCRFVVSMHDDIRYTLALKHPLRDETLRMAGEVWRDADHRFVISEELAREYGTRYGERPWEINTDGLEEIPSQAAPIVPGRLRVYFMGLFHSDYRENLSALCGALAQLKKDLPETKIELIMRCGGFKKGTDAAFPARMLPYADQAAVIADMADVDLLYLPLPVGARYEPFTRFSLSTKMVSYLGSGVPILYHGPPGAAVAGLLEKHQAAFACHSLDEGDLVRALVSSLVAGRRDEVVGRALELARTRFSLIDLRRKFLGGLAG
jgi:hypothetical protein